MQQLSHYGNALSSSRGVYPGQALTQCASVYSSLSTKIWNGWPTSSFIFTIYLEVCGPCRSVCTDRFRPYLSSSTARGKSDLGSKNRTFMVSLLLILTVGFVQISATSRAPNGRPTNYQPCVWLQFGPAPAWWTDGLNHWEPGTHKTGWKSPLAWPEMFLTYRS